MWWWPKIVTTVELFTINFVAVRCSRPARQLLLRFRDGMVTAHDVGVDRANARAAILDDGSGVAQCAAASSEQMEECAHWVPPAMKGSSEEPAEMAGGSEKLLLTVSPGRATA